MTENDKELSADAGGIPDLSSAIGKLMAHPEILQMAASVLREAPSGNAEEEEDTSSESDTAEGNPPPTDAGNNGGGGTDLSSLLRLAGPLLSGKGIQSSHSSEKGGGGLIRCTALLVALKPYLSPSRCETVDKIVTLNRFSSLFETLR